MQGAPSAHRRGGPAAVSAQLLGSRACADWQQRATHAVLTAVCLLQVPSAAAQL